VFSIWIYIATRQIFILNADICSTFPLSEMQAFHGTVSHSIRFSRSFVRQLVNERTNERTRADFRAFFLVCLFADVQHRGVGTIVGKQVPKGTEQRFGVMVVDNETKQAIHYVEKVSSIHPI